MIITKFSLQVFSEKALTLILTENGLEQVSVLDDFALYRFSSFHQITPCLGNLSLWADTKKRINRDVCSALRRI